MIIRRPDTRPFPIPACHGGEGSVICREYLGDYARDSAGFTFVHEDLLAPGVSIGAHTHGADEEIYWITEGSGTFVIDGERTTVGPGDFCLTRTGQTHSLVNDGQTPLRILVIGTNLATV